MNFKFVIEKDGVIQHVDCEEVFQKATSYEKFDWYGNTETEEKEIDGIVKMFRLLVNEPSYRHDSILKNLEEEIGKVSNVNLFVRSIGLQYNHNLLFHASRENCLEAVDMLLKKGANPRLVNDIGISVLHLMAERGQKEMAEKCLSQIRDNEKHDFVNQGSTSYQGSASGWTPLMAAAENDQLDFVEWLLWLDHPHRVEVNKKMKEGWTAKKMKDGWTAMHAAVKKNNADIVYRLFANFRKQDIVTYHKENVYADLKKLTIDEKILQILDEQKHDFDKYL
jgi:hypothetical protein